MKKIAAIAVLASLMVAGALAGCTGLNERFSGISGTVVVDKPAILPQWTDGSYHNSEAAAELLAGFEESYPDLVYVFSIGKTTEGKEIFCIRITNEKSDAEKLSCLIDGNIHGSEFEGGEMCLYLAEYLLINYGANKTARAMVDDNEIYIVPILNPEGRDADTRYNSNGVNINRNFDIDWGNPTSLNVRDLPDPIRTGHTFENCGPAPFSEPESQAIRDFMETIHNRNFAFYLTHHTPAASVISSWGASMAPFELPERDSALIENVLQWVRDNTEYLAGKAAWGNMSANLPYAASGTSMDWCYLRHRVPSFTFELEGARTKLVYEMKAGLPIALYLLTNIQNLYNWDIPDLLPVLPEGVPPKAG